MTSRLESGAGPGEGGPYLKIRGVTKMFGDFAAITDISLDINQGEFICFLGPSGCGKTTLLRAIAGLDIQTRGRIEQAGRDISGLPPDQRDFGIVFQSYALFPNFNVEKNVGYGLESQKKGKAEIADKVSELLQLVNMTDQAKKYPAQLSGGQQQRVALARALATSPGLLLLDEPLSALDAKVRVRLRHEIKLLQHKLRVTTILVTHDQEEALSVADRIVVMKSGIIEQVGTPMEIYRQPANRFVSDFVGSMNFISANVVGNGKIRLGKSELTVDHSVDHIPVGTEVSACIRPESIIARNLTTDTPNRCQVKVIDLEFLGSYFQARLSLINRPDIIVQADFSMNLVSDIGIADGQILTVAFPPAEIRVLLMN